MIMSDAFKKSVPARTPAVVALYETPCKDALYRRLGFTADGLPDSYTLMVTAFDRLKAKAIWYEWMPELMDLFARYNLSTTNEDGSAKPQHEWCPTILFQPADWSQPVIAYNPSKDGTYLQWVWSQLAIKEISFKNTLDKQVNLVIKSGDSHSKNLVNEAVIAQIAAQQTQTLTPTEIGGNLHAGDTIVAVDNEDNVINRYLLNTVDLEIEITQSSDSEVIDDKKYEEMMDRNVKLRNARDWSTRRRYLNNIRTPPYMPSFTDKGFKYLPMPQEICEYVTKFHRENFLEANKKRSEPFPRDGTQINAREIDTFMVHIPPDKKQWIGDLLRPMLEEWSGVKLRYSTIYGMREYIQGAVLKGHVDRVETHIISAILHIYHDPPDEPWPIEVVSWDGKRYHIEDEPCMMTFYESAKLIHGRPATYNGTSWVNAFLHYRPMDWKGYKFTPDNKLITPTDEIALVDWIYG
eukprot:CAMPEP_0197044144 /NCGR_PEP_ID=MMETSP1384-20130603/20263_1 /TAXON_ID=29189 /ORGANISM="Ammonia sp." /LENGTH=464 /DNA_ID=CAMNT_0042475545 /DNA_START=114 /DNA_END=1508 /DNA_ORIENTATION=-